jgi:outer membrane lipoprotein-sorting protein
LFQPSINQAIEGQVSKTLNSNSSGAGFLSLFFGGLSQATRDYQIAAVGDEVVNGRRTTHLRLTPQSGRKGLYRQIDMWVDNNLWLPTQQRLVEVNQDVTLLKLADIQVNVALPDHLFTQKLPGNVQRVRS